MQSRRHLLPFAAIITTLSLSMLLEQAHFAAAYSQPVTGAAVFNVFVGSFIGFSILTAPLYWGIALIVARRRLRRLQSVWDAHNAAVVGIQNRLAALWAAHNDAMRRAQEAMGSAYYCDLCAGCFWATLASRDIPEWQVLTPDQFRSVLAKAGGYAELATYYRRS